jgi:hypothetical protein
MVKRLKKSYKLIKTIYKFLNTTFLSYLQKREKQPRFSVFFTDKYNLHLMEKEKA